MDRESGGGRHHAPLCAPGGGIVDPLWAHDELVANVTKMLEGSEEKEEPKEETETPVSESDETPPEDSKEPKDEEKPVELSEDLQTRAERAGLSQELAQQLHQAGHLEATLAAIDKQLLERFQSRETEEKGETPTKAEKPEKPVEVPDLDPEVYDEQLVQRDAYHKQRIDALEAQLAELENERMYAFDQWMDTAIDELARDDLFGTGASVAQEKQANRDKVAKA